MDIPICGTAARALRRIAKLILRSETVANLLAAIHNGFELGDTGVAAFSRNDIQNGQARAAAHHVLLFALRRRGAIRCGLKLVSNIGPYVRRGRIRPVLRVEVNNRSCGRVTARTKPNRTYAIVVNPCVLALRIPWNNYIPVQVAVRGRVEWPALHLLPLADGVDAGGCTPSRFLIGVEQVACGV